MNTSTWRYKFQLFTLAALAAVGGGSAGAAQYIDSGTATATAESDSDGGWGNLLPDRESSSTTQVDGDVYVLPSSGAEVVIGADITITHEEGQVEDQLIFQNEFGIGAIAALGIVSAPEVVRDSYVEGFGGSMESVDVVEADESRSVATGIYVFVSNGLPLYMYISVDAATLPGHMIIEVFIGEPAKMAEGIALSRENISIDGVPMFEGLDEQEVEDIAVREEG